MNKNFDIRVYWNVQTQVNIAEKPHANRMANMGPFSVRIHDWTHLWKQTKNSLNSGWLLSFVGQPFLLSISGSPLSRDTSFNQKITMKNSFQTCAIFHDWKWCVSLVQTFIQRVQRSDFGDSSEISAHHPPARAVADFRSLKFPE